MSHSRFLSVAFFLEKKSEEEEEEEEEQEEEEEEEDHPSTQRADPLQLLLSVTASALPTRIILLFIRRANTLNPAYPPLKFRKQF